MNPLYNILNYPIFNSSPSSNTIKSRRNKYWSQSISCKTF